MLYVKYALLAIVGFSCGALVAGGVFAFIVKIGVLERLAVRTKTVKRVKWYEDFVVIGGAIGNFVYLFEWHVPLRSLMLILYGLGSGIFVGVLSFSLAEVLNVIPVIVNRIKLKVGLPYIILSFAIGKILGALYDFFSK
ncbi:MAG: stage V sporulation protein AB [Lachnospiraceae bacterium]|nr:stage V sporulation protein AB [Lachnospiraceae bacterium]